MELGEICKLVKCHQCVGRGFVNRYPHYGIPMPKMRSERCDHCNGVGQVVLVASGITTVRDSSFVHAFTLFVDPN